MRLRRVASSVRGRRTGVQGFWFLSDRLRQERAPKARYLEVGFQIRDREIGRQQGRVDPRKERREIGELGAQDGDQARSQAVQAKVRVSTQEDELRAEIRRAARAIGAPNDFEPILERPRDPSFGDWATNAAMTLAKTLKKKPRDIAEALVTEIGRDRAGI